MYKQEQAREDGWEVNAKPELQGYQDIRRAISFNLHNINTHTAQKVFSVKLVF